MTTISDRRIPRPPSGWAVFLLPAMALAAVVTAIVMAAGVGFLNRELEGETVLRWAAVGFVAGLLLGAAGGLAGAPLKGVVVGGLLGLVLLAVSAVLRPAVGLAGELRSFDPGTTKGLLEAAAFGLTVGAIGGGVGGGFHKLMKL